MQTEVERTLRNLTVVASLVQNDKLITNDVIFAVHEPSTSRSLYRMVYRETREHNLIKLQTIVREAKTFVTATMTHSAATVVDPSFHGVLQSTTNQQMCLRMINALRQSTQGLRHLQQTYKDDASIKAKLQILVDEIDDFLLATQRASPQLEARSVDDHPSPISLT